MSPAVLPATRAVFVPFVTLAAIATIPLGACVDVPPNIRDEFRPPSPDDRTNYRPGAHSTSPPADASDPGPSLVSVDGGAP